MISLSGASNRSQDAYLVWDLQQRGLAINIHPTGRKTFKCIYSRQGRSRWYNLGAADAIGLADARKLASRVMFQVAEEKIPPQNAAPSETKIRSLSSRNATLKNTSLIPSGKPPSMTRGRRRVNNRDVQRGDRSMRKLTRRETEAIFEQTPSRAGCRRGWKPKAAP